MKNILFMTLTILVLTLTSCTTQFERVDDEAPVITINPYEEAFYLGGTTPIISANCIDDEDETCLVRTPNYPDLTVAGEHTVTFTATDKAGNKATETITVTAIDRSAYITLTIGTYEPTVELGTEYILPTATCTSTESEFCTITMPETIPTDVVNTALTYAITGTDTNDHAKTIEITIAVVDTTSPTIGLVGDEIVTIELGNLWTDQGVTTTDLQTVDITTDIIPDLNTVGTYVVTYTATDASDNVSTIQRTVNVVDTTDPVITLVGDAVIELTVGTTWTDPGVTTTDLQTVVVTTLETPTLDLNTVGSYVITYTATDTSGNTAEVQRTVNVS